MQYTVVGKEATAGDPNDRPDLVFQTLDGYITAARSQIRNGRASAAPLAIRSLPRTNASRHPPHGSPMRRRASIRCRITSASTPRPNGWSGSTGTTCVFADPAPARSSQRAGGGARPDRGSSISRRWAGCASRSLPRSSRSTRAAIGGPAPRVGEHSRAVLHDLGYSDAAVDAMIADKSVRAASN